MAIQAMQQAQDLPSGDAQADWPDLIVSRAHLRPEDDHWVAILERFSIVGMGDTPGAAWSNMDELACAYLDLCEHEGQPFEAVVRPLPFLDRVRLRAGSLYLSLLVAAFRKAESDRRRPTTYVHAHPHPHHAVAC